MARYAVYQESDQALPTNVARGFLKRNAANTAWEQVATHSIFTDAAADIALSNSRKITGLGTPTGAGDAANKSYVDSAVAGARDVKDACKFASTANVTIAGPGANIDGQAMAQDDRILLKNQTDAGDNGIYIFNGAASAMTRASDADVSAEVTNGMFVWVTAGDTNAKSGWLLTTADPITLDTTDLTFVQVSGLGDVTAGAGLTKSGNTLDVGANGDGSITVNANDIQVGILATDAQHGVRGGGDQHADATSTDGDSSTNAATSGFASAGEDGFMPAADKAKLTNINPAFAGKLQTTNATPGLIVSLNTVGLRPAQEAMVLVEVEITGIKNDFSQAAAYKLVAVFIRNAADAMTQVGSTTVLYQFEDDAAWDADFSVTGSGTGAVDVNIRVIGVATTTINWGCRGRVCTP